MNVVWSIIFISAFAVSAEAKISTGEIKTQLAERAAIIKSIENKILRNQAELKTLRKKLTEIEQSRTQENKTQKSAHAAFVRLIRRPDNMPLVAGLDLVRGEKIISDLQSKNVLRLNHLAARNSSIAQLTADIQIQQKALRTELKNRRKAHKEIETLLSQKASTLNKKWDAQTKNIAGKTRNASSLISAIIATEFGKKYAQRKSQQNFLFYPGAGTIQSGFGEKNAFGIHFLGASFAMLPAARIIAPAGGLVVFAGTFQKFGKTIILAIPGGYHILLSGLVRLDVQAGDSVYPREPLGLMPLTTKKKPLLYFELRHLGRPINPEPLFWTNPKGEKNEN